MDKSLIIALISAFVVILQTIIGPILSWHLQLSLLKKEDPNSNAYKNHRKWLGFHIAIVAISIVVFIVSSIFTYLWATELGKILPGLSPIWMEKLESNGKSNVHLEDENPHIPADVRWNKVEQDRANSEMLSLTKLTEQIIELQRFNQYLFYHSKLNEKMQGFTAISFKKLAILDEPIFSPINLSSKAGLILVIHALKKDTIEIKLKDVQGNEPRRYLPLEKDWGVYYIPTNIFKNGIDLDSIKQIQIAHSSIISKNHDNTFKLVWLYAH